MYKFGAKMNSLNFGMKADISFAFENSSTIKQKFSSFVYSRKANQKV